MMGDHRFISQDSRAWQHKFVPRENIIGRAVIVYWSFNATRDDFRISARTALAVSWAQ